MRSPETCSHIERLKDNRILCSSIFLSNIATLFYDTTSVHDLLIADRSRAPQLPFRFFNNKPPTSTATQSAQQLYVVRLGTVKPPSYTPKPTPGLRKTSLQLRVDIPHSTFHILHSTFHSENKRIWTEILKDRRSVIGHRRGFGQKP